MFTRDSGMRRRLQVHEARARFAGGQLGWHTRAALLLMAIASNTPVIASADPTSAVSRGMGFLEAQWSRDEGSLWADYLMGLAIVAAGAMQEQEQELAGRCMTLAATIADQIVADTPRLPDTVSPAVVHRQAGNLLSLAAVGRDHPVLRAELGLVLPHFSPQALFGFDANAGSLCWADQDRDRGTPGRPEPLLQIGAWTRALVHSFVGEAAGLVFAPAPPAANPPPPQCNHGSRAGRATSAAEVPVPDSRHLDVLRWLPRVRRLYALDTPCVQGSLLQLAERGMAATHVVYVVAHYGLRGGDELRREWADLLRPEREFLLRCLPAFVWLGSADLVGESLDALKQVGVCSGDNIRQGEAYLLGTQRADGSWDGEYHATMVAMWGLRPCTHGQLLPRLVWRMGNLVGPNHQLAYEAGLRAVLLGHGRDPGTVGWVSSVVRRSMRGILTHAIQAAVITLTVAIMMNAQILAAE